ncbi:MAG: hypothetical protein GPJ51_15380 [Candidatus Heimdallarchaeota archaeon]|nr:hypothetical protein [Candidatus Heimdallarchaeota archaeon]
MVGFPREFSIYLPILDKSEQEELTRYQEDFRVEDSLVKLGKFLLDFVEKQKNPSANLLFSIGKILFSISDYSSLENFNKNSHYSIKLWQIRILLEKGMNEVAIRLASEIKDIEDISPLFRLHAIRSIAYGYLNLGNYEQCRINLNILFEEAFTSQKLPTDQKQILNDILLDGHADNFFLNRYVEEKIKLENKINLALQIATDLGDRNHIAKFCYLLALLNRDSGKLDESLSMSEKAKSLFESTGNQLILTAVRGNIATLNSVTGNLDAAEKEFTELLDIFKDLEANRYLALTIKCLGDIAIERGQFNDAIKKYEEALKIIEKLNMKETYHYCTLAELYLQTNRLTDFEIFLNSIVEEIRTNPSPIIESYVFLLKGMYSVKKLNYGQAVEEFSKALEIADRHGSGELSAKILMNLVLMQLENYDLEKDKKILGLTLNNLNDLIPYFSENKLVKEQVALYLLQGKILALQEDYTRSFNRLQQAKELASENNLPQLHKLIEGKIEQINLLFPIEEVKEIDWVNEPFRKDISILEEVGLRHMQKPYVDFDASPLALIILHRSGIPLRSYVILKRAVKDQLLFGGFIVAVRDMLTELFEEQKSQMLVITYGNHKIIIEAHPKGFSSVAVSALDSFSLRRKIHQLTDKLSQIDIPKQFFGELSDEVSDAIDFEVQELFGPHLVFSDAIKVDF